MMSDLCNCNNEDKVFNPVMFGFYSDKTTSGGTVSVPMEYSLEEKAIGTWVDGKTIYQKTIHITEFPTAAGEKVYETGIFKVNEFISCNFRLTVSNGNPVLSNYYTNSYDRFMVWTNASKKLVFTCAGSLIGTANCYVTLQYTCTDR